MHPFLCFAAALALGQADPGQAAAEPPPPPAAAEQAPPAPPPAQEGAAEEPSPPPAPAEKPRPRPRPAAAAAPAAPPPSPSALAPSASASAAPGAAPARPGEPEKAQVARAALAFLDALLAGDAAKLAAAASERFSFDGEVRTGREQVQRAWRELLAGRAPADRGTLLDLELLPAVEAVARLGPPPARLVPLATARGSWVAIANVSRRPVVLFLTREGSRFAVAGME
jgi:hypothetical protein